MRLICPSTEGARKLFSQMPNARFSTDVNRQTDTLLKHHIPAILFSCTLDDTGKFNPTARKMWLFEKMLGTGL